MKLELTVVLNKLLRKMSSAVYNITIKNLVEYCGTFDK